MSNGSSVPWGESAVLAAVRSSLPELGSARPIVVAFSGGLDSCVLLHALRYHVTVEGAEVPEVTAAHFDHAMRDGSAGDAVWAAGVCRAWGLPIVTERSRETLTSEADARTARYAFLEGARAEAGDDAILLTAHHADDQAETVLFRLLRGTGPDGLRGIYERRPGMARPLVHVWREELEAYAAEHGLRWREDPTNEQLGYARNALRHEVLPLIERSVAPGARHALLRLARLAAADADAWSNEVLPWLTLAMEFERSSQEDGSSGRRVQVAREALLLFSPGLRARVIRYLAAEVGASLDEAAVRRVDGFLSSSSSGRTIELGRGATVGLELDRVVFAVPDSTRPPDVRSAAGVDDEPVFIESGGEGSSRALLAGRPVWVAWVEEEGEGISKEREASFDVSAVSFPLQIRARAPGDRLRRTGGSRKVKKILLEHRIPSIDRNTLPVLVDASGEVLWIPGVARSTVAIPSVGTPSLRIRIEP